MLTLQFIFYHDHIHFNCSDLLLHHLIKYHDHGIHWCLCLKLMSLGCNTQVCHWIVQYQQTTNWATLINRETKWLDRSPVKYYLIFIKSNVYTSKVSTDCYKRPVWQFHYSGSVTKSYSLLLDISHAFSYLICLVRDLLCSRHYEGLLAIHHHSHCYQTWFWMKFHLPHYKSALSSL